MMSSSKTTRWICICGIFFLFSFFIGLYFHKYSNSKKYSLSKEKVLDIFHESSLVECADFYVANRKRSHYVDKLYIDSILPLMMYSDYPTIRKVNEVLNGTPAQKIIEPFYEKVREMYLQEVKLEIENNAELMKTALRNEVVAFIELELDSLLTNDITGILNDYSGGFLGYKKIGLFLGRDKEKFQEIWERELKDSIYSELIYRYFDNYLIKINTYYDDYCYSLLNRKVGNKLVFELPHDLVIKYTTLQDSLVSDYISLAKKNMRNETLKDFASDIIPMIVGGGISVLFPPAAPLGVAVMSYGPTALSVGVVVNDVLKNEPTPEDLLVMSSVHLCIDYLKNDYIDKYVLEVDEKIDERSELIYNVMCKYL